MQKLSHGFLRMSSKDCRKLDRECQGWHSTNMSAKPANASGIFNLLNVNHVLRRTFPDLFRTLRHLACKSVDGLRMRPFFSLKRHRTPGISAFADVGIEFDAPQKRDAELTRRAFASALGEDVDLVIAMRAHEV